MCGRYGFVPTDNFFQRYNIKLPQPPLPFKASVNIAPGSMVPAVVWENGNLIRMMKWGLIPSWAKDPKIGYKMINARIEGIAEKPSYGKPFRTQRCLIPASGFYEWQTTPVGKTPYYFTLKNQPVFSFAAIFDVWSDPEGYPFYSFSIITTSPNEVVMPMHDRMPAILSLENEPLWLDPKNNDPKSLLPLIQSYPALEMQSSPAALA